MNHRRVLATIGTFLGVVAGAVMVAGPAYAVAPDGYHKIVNAIDGKCADVSGMSTTAGALIHLWECESSNDDNQYWLPNDLGDGTFTLRNLHSGLCMNVKEGSSSPGALIEQRACDSRVSERWRWQFADTFGHRVLTSSLVTFSGGELCLALVPYSSVNGARIVTAECATTSGQMWRFSPED